MKPISLKALCAGLLLSVSAQSAWAVDYMQMFNSLPESEKQKLIQQYAPQAAALAGQADKGVSTSLGIPTEPPKRDVNQELSASSSVKEAKEGMRAADLVEKQVSTSLNQALKPFGYDLFAGEPQSFVQLANVPVPSDYVMGPGDTLNVALFGAQNQTLALLIDREGYVQLPQIGPLTVAGLSFTEARQSIVSAIKRGMIGVDVRVTTGALRSIRVFMLGEVFRPGSYVVSGLSTLSQALIASGGIKEIGSLRQVELRRSGKTIATLDLYDFLLKGDMRQDKVLQEGDVVFVPTVKTRVALGGEVLRPAIYELKNESQWGEVVDLAGGFTNKASQADVKLERLRKDGYREIIDLDFTQRATRQMRVQQGDTLRVLAGVEEYKNIILLTGNVTRPGDYQWRKGMKIADLFPGPLRDAVLPQTDVEHVLIRRESRDGRRIEILMANLIQALNAPATQANLELQSRDQLIFLPNSQEARQGVVGGLVQVLMQQARLEDEAKVVEIAGFVRFPGVYPLTPGMHVHDLIGLAGGMSEAAYGHQAELVRIGRSQDGEVQRVDHQVADLSAGVTQGILLKPRDTVSIKQLPEYAERKLVKLGGEVRFPGDYVIKEEETLADLIERAGGLSPRANPIGIQLIRTRIKQQQFRELETLRVRLRQLMAQGAANRNQSTPATFEELDKIMAMANEVQATGRLSLSLNNETFTEQFAQIRLEKGDEILIPERSSTVSVLGEVFSSQALLYQPGFAPTDYIAQAGGVNAMGDLRNAYVVKASGVVVPLAMGSIFYSQRVTIEPGDAVVVPMDLDRLKPLEFWKEIASIAGQIGLALASFKTVGIF